MFTDYHTHSYRCGHASGRMREYIEAALRRGVEEIGLTDHLFLYFQPPAERSERWAMPESQYDEHYDEMLHLRDEYRGKINVRVSVEADYDSAHEKQLASILSKYDFDFILGSVHFLGEWMIDDVEQSSRYRSERVVAIYRRYYEQIRALAGSGLFDVVGHLDLPKKFGYLPEEDLGPDIDLTLDQIAKAGLAVEVSTAGLRKPVGEIYPSRPLLAQMRARDIPIVLSSDAHSSEEVAADYRLSVPLVLEMGYSELVTFDKRERSHERIG